MTDPIIEAMCLAMRTAVISDDEGEFPRLFDLLDFSGENKAHTVTRGLAKAAYLAAWQAENAGDIAKWHDEEGWEMLVDDIPDAIRALAAAKVEDLK